MLFVDEVEETFGMAVVLASTEVIALSVVDFGMMSESSVIGIVEDFSGT